MTITSNEDLHTKLEQALIAEGNSIGLSLFRAMDSLGLKLRLHDSETKYDAPEKTIYMSNNLIDAYSLQRGFDAAIAGLFNHEFEHHFDAARTVARYNDALAIDSRAYSKHLFYVNEADALFDQFMKKTDYGLNYGNVSNAEIQLVKQELQAAFDRRDISWSAFETALKANITSKLEAAGHNQAAAEDYANAVDRHHGRPIAPRTGEEVRYFQDRYEQEDITRAMNRVANLTEADIREIAAYEGLAPLLAGATVNLSFSNLTSEINSEDEFTIAVPSLAHMIRAGITVQEAVTSTLMNQLGTSLMASGIFGQEAAFDFESFNNAIDNDNLSGFMDGLSQLEARSYFSQYYAKERLGLDIPIFTSEGQDLTALLNQLIPGSVESVIDSTGGILTTLAGEIRTSMNVDKSGLMLNGSRDPDSPYRPQITGGFMYIPQEILLGMTDRFGTDYFPSADQLLDDISSIQELEHLTPAMDYRVYVDNQPVDAGSAFCRQAPSTHGYIRIGDNEINRLTIFVNGELWLDQYCDLRGVPIHALGAEAVYAYNCLGDRVTANWLDFPIPPPWFWGNGNVTSTASGTESDVYANTSSTLIEAMSQWGPTSVSNPSYRPQPQDQIFGIAPSI